MELALYCPVYGYYEKEEDTIGRRGDYYTSVSVGSLFGKLLAVQFADWLGDFQSVGSKSQIPGPKCAVSECQQPEPPVDWGKLQIVEGGAHDGKLAGDVLTWMRRWRPDLFDQLEYCILEPSPRRREWQYACLKEFSSRLQWANNISELIETESTTVKTQRLRGVRGIVFCNELLDAMPVHRWGWDASRQCWFEWGVTLQKEQLVWARVEDSKSRDRQAETLKSEAPQANRTLLSNAGFDPSAADPSTALPAQMLESLEDGFTLETCPAALQWWSTAAAALGCGKLVAIDYGFTWEELFAGRKHGTLTAYRRHQHCPDLLQDPGEQDLTAHVNFSQLQKVGESAGLRTESFLTQSQFLTRFVARIWDGATPFEPWTSAHTRQFQSLTHPDHMGHAYRVVVQAKAG